MNKNTGNQFNLGGNNDDFGGGDDGWNVPTGGGADRRS